jgi:site-specific recombinase XerD
LYKTDPYIVCNEIGNYIDPSTYRKWFKSITEKVGLSGRITPHTLRHTFASTALKCGVDLKNISDVLGHYSTSFTARTYIHTDLKGKYEAMTAMYKVFEGNERKDDDESKMLS